MCITRLSGLHSRSVSSDNYVSWPIATLRIALSVQTVASSKMLHWGHLASLRILSTGHLVSAMLKSLKAAGSGWPGSRHRNSHQADPLVDLTFFLAYRKWRGVLWCGATLAGGLSAFGWCRESQGSTDILSASLSSCRTASSIGLGRLAAP